MVVYLAGSIAGHTYNDANAWRLEVDNILSAEGIKTLNPLRGRMFYPHNTIIQAGDTEIDRTPQEIVSRDLEDVRVCDVVLAKLDTRTIGTICEVWEGFRTGKPVIVVSSNPDVVKHPWILFAATRVFGTLKEGIDFIITRFKDMDETMLPEKWV